jgi:hypothetical protein
MSKGDETGGRDSTVTIIKQQYAVSLGEIGDEFELGSRDGQVILVDEIEEATACAQLVANEAQRPTRVLKVSEIAFLRPERQIDLEKAS